MPRHKYRISEEKELKIIEMVDKGIHYKVISKELNVSTNTITRTFHRLGIKPPGNNGKQRLFKKYIPEIIQLYNNGMTITDLMKKYKTSYHVMKNILKRQNIKIRGQGSNRRIWTEEDKQDILEKYNNGLSQAKIAKIYGTNQEKISNILRRLGIITKNFSAERNGNWTGGKVIRDYILILLQPNHPYFCMTNTARYVPEHRLVMAESLGRPLQKSETVHHINGNRHDNRLENLQLRQGQHGEGQIYKCNCCGSNDIIAVEL